MLSYQCFLSASLFHIYAVSVYASRELAPLCTLACTFVPKSYEHGFLTFSLICLSLCSPATSNPFTQKPPLFSTLLYSLVPIMGIAAIALLSFWMYRHHKLAYPPVLVPTQVGPNVSSEHFAGSRSKSTNARLNPRLISPSVKERVRLGELPPPPYDATDIISSITREMWKI